MWATDRAKDLYVKGVSATADMRPAVGARLLRAALAEGVEGADRGRVLVSLAHAEAEQGRVDLGLRLLDEAQPLLPPPRLGVLFGQRGLFLLRTGRNELALPHLDSAITLLGERSHPEDLARALLNRGVLHMDCGRIRPARADLSRCTRIAATHGLARIAAKARHNLAFLDYLAGDLPAALGIFGEVARDYAELSPWSLPVLSVDKARALLAAGLFAEAERELIGALEHFRRQRVAQDRAEAELALAEAALLARKPAVARQWAVLARSHFQRRGNDRWATLASLLALRADLSLAASPRSLPGRAMALADALSEAGLGDDARLSSLVAVRAMVATGQTAAAVEEMARIGPPRKGGRLDIRLFWRLAQAEVAGALGRHAEASRRLTTGLAELHRHRSQLGSLDLQTGTAVHGRDLAQIGLRAALCRGSTTDMYRWAERARAQALLLPPIRPPDDPGTAAMLERLRQTRYELRQAELSGTPTGALRTRSDALQRKLREHSWAAAGTVTAARYAPFAAVKAELSDAAMIIYLLDAARLRALVVLSSGAKLIDLGPYADAETALLRLRGDLDASAGRVMPQRLAMAVAAATRNNASMLARAILEPILGMVGDRELVVVPTGLLITVPWAILPGCAQRPVTVAPSATTWWTARNRLRAIDLRPGPAATLIVAGPGNERGDAEAREIAALRSNSTTLTGTSATPAATLAALEKVTIAHIAAHGRHEADNALFSALELSGGPLMGYDLQRLDSTPAIVVLSSCDLGLSDVRPGDETLGMVTALLSTGSSTVVASVGRIGDETAMAVMSAYHKGICAGRPSPVALAEAGGRVAADVAGNAVSFVCFGAG